MGCDGRIGLKGWETGPSESESLYSLSAVSIFHTLKTNGGITC